MALAARQLLIERVRLSPAEAIRRLTPLQAQHPPAPYLGLAARVAGFSRDDLQVAIESGQVVKTTIMRGTLHLAEAGDYPAYAQLLRQAWLRAWRRRYPHLDEAKVARELRRWFARPRTNAEIRVRVRRYEGVPDNPWEPVNFARTLLTLVQLPPAGFWSDTRRPYFAVHPRRPPDPVSAATLVVKRYLAAFGPASRRDLAGWAGIPQRDLGPALEHLGTVAYRDARGTELLDLPGAPLPSASTRLPPRLLGNWDQPLLAYADRERIIPPEVRPLGLTLSGDPTVLVDGQIAASWRYQGEGETVRLIVTPHVELPRVARGQIRAEAELTASFCAPEARRIEVLGV